MKAIINQKPTPKKFIGVYIFRSFLFIVILHMLVL